MIRWSWRVSFYGYTALATDRFPSFTLADVPDYPARLEIDYPQELNRWLPLVKWLLAIPQYILVGALVGSGYVVATTMQDGRAVTYSTPQLDRRVCADRGYRHAFHYALSPGLFDLAVGINRWGYRLLVYAALMTDRYPPFRLDQGSVDVEGPKQPPAAIEASQWRSRPGTGVHRPCIVTCCCEVVHLVSLFRRSASDGSISCPQHCDLETAPFTIPQVRPCETPRLDHKDRKPVGLRAFRSVSSSDPIGRWHGEWQALATCSGTSGDMLQMRRRAGERVGARG